MPRSEAPWRRRALYLAYTFPPVGGAGVQRTTKFVKYLPASGWDATVVTVSNPSVPVRDESLCRDVPASTHVLRARTFEPSYRTKQAMARRPSPHGIGRAVSAAMRAAAMTLLQPDPQVLWNVPAFRAAIRALREARHEVIVASGPPFSSLLLGAALSQYAQLPLVLDYRDEWDVCNQHWEHRRPATALAALQRAMERYALRQASVVIATSPRSAERLRRLCRDARSTAAVTHIFNGFDPEDFADGRVELRAADRRWRLVYTGTLYSLMSPEPLVGAIESLAASEPEVAARIELVIAGRRVAEQEAALARLTNVCALQIRDYLPHPDAIALMRSADALCILLGDLPGADRVVPAKTFEYIAAGRPILAVAPRGEVWDLLHHHPAAFRFTPDDRTGLRAWLSDAVRGWRGTGAPPAVEPAPFDRRRQTGHLAALLDAVAAPRPVSQPLVEETA
jgi:glycosyltransferase involved in cell wall biosynthesis